MRARKDQSKRNETRAEIVRVGTEIIGRSGFNSTGIDAVLKSAGVPKGSFYYYFASKEDFGLAVIDEFAQDYDAKLKAALSLAEIPPLERIRDFFSDSVRSYGGDRCKRGCLIGTLGQEMASQHERFRARIDEVFKGWEQRFATCLEEAKAQGQLPDGSSATQLAQFLLSGWEGALLRAKVTKSNAPLRDFVEVVFETVLKPGAKAR